MVSTSYRMGVEGSTGGAVVVLLAIALLLLTGCSTLLSSSDPGSEFASVRPEPRPLPPQRSGAIFQAGYEMSMFEDLHARRVGDILTIVLSESTNASKTASTNTAKDDEVDIANPIILGANPRFSIPRPFSSNLDDRSFLTTINAEREFSGRGNSAQSNSLSGYITVTVAEVYSNGNLLVRGQKELTINQGKEFVQFSGVVRPADILSDNSVFSSQVADAKIRYIGEGTLADANNQGWLTAFLSSKWWPF